MVRVRVRGDVEEAYRRLLILEHDVPEALVREEDTSDLIRWYARLEAEESEADLSDLDLSS